VSPASSHVHREAPATPYIFRGRYTDGYAAPTVLIDSGGERLQMHAFTRPSRQLRRKVRHALLRSLYYSYLYRRLILKHIEAGTNTYSVRKAIHHRLTANAWEGSTLLKFIYGQLYNGKLAKRYGHTPTDECPLCHKPDSCTHLAGECPQHKALTTCRHNAAGQLVHAACRLVHLPYIVFLHGCRQLAAFLQKHLRL
jgi:hypothetical protein